MQNKKPFMGVVWIFSGTAHCEKNADDWKNTDRDFAVYNTVPLHFLILEFHDATASTKAKFYQKCWI